MQLFKWPQVIYLGFCLVRRPITLEEIVEPMIVTALLSTNLSNCTACLGSRLPCSRSISTEIASENIARSVSTRTYREQTDFRHALVRVFLHGGGLERGELESICVFAYRQKTSGEALCRLLKSEDNLMRSEHCMIKYNTVDVNPGWSGCVNSIEQSIASVMKKKTPWSQVIDRVYIPTIDLF